MGNYFFQSFTDKDEVKVEYTFGYIKNNEENLLINLHPLQFLLQANFIIIILIILIF